MFHSFYKRPRGRYILGGGGVGLVTHILPVGRGAILSFRSLVFFALPSISLVWSSSSLTTNRELLRGGSYIGRLYRCDDSLARRASRDP